MANFQKVPNDKTTRLDTSVGRLVLMLDEKVQIDLFGGGPSGEDLIVGLNDPTIASVSVEPIKRNGLLRTYEVQGIQSGNAMLEARLFNQSFADAAAQRRMWFKMPVWASLQVSVLGAEYRQAGGTWGNLTYGSTKPQWKHVHWTNMALAGCGPTSLAIVIDYLDRLDSPSRNAPVSYGGVDPSKTMKYTSQYGRAADDKGQPSGTSGPIMIANIGKYWPNFAGEKVNTVDEATALLRAGSPLVFLCRNCTTYKYDQKGNKKEMKWPGHFMVLLGVENDEETFWISDPSLAHHKYISREELEGTDIWYIHKVTDVAAVSL
jgi:Peptidase_C39 like family